MLEDTGLFVRAYSPKELGIYDAVNVRAAGTLVIRKPAPFERHGPTFIRCQPVPRDVYWINSPGIQPVWKGRNYHDNIFG